MSHGIAPVRGRRTISPLHPCKRFNLRGGKWKEMEKCHCVVQKNTLLCGSLLSMFLTVWIIARALLILDIFKLKSVFYILFIWHIKKEKTSKITSLFQAQSELNDTVCKQTKLMENQLLYPSTLILTAAQTPITDANEGSDYIWSTRSEVGGGRGEAPAFKLIRGSFFTSEGSMWNSAVSSLYKTGEKLWNGRVTRRKRIAWLCSHQLKPWL